MNNDSKEILAGIFKSKSSLYEMINTLEEIGIAETDINILMSMATKKNEFSIDTKKNFQAELMKGFVAGSLLGSILGNLNLISSISFPGVGLIISGPLIGFVKGSATGGLVGSFQGVLLSLGIPENEALFYEQVLIESGNILMIIQADHDLSPNIRKELERYGAINPRNQ